MTGAPPHGRRPPSFAAPPLAASLLLHGAALAALAALHMQGRLPDAPRERGVEIVWQDNPEDAAPGAGAEAAPDTAETADRREPAPELEPEQDVAQHAPVAEPPTEPEATPPETPPQGPPLAQAPELPAQEPPQPPQEPPLAGAPAEPEPPLAEAPPPEPEAESEPPPAEPPPPRVAARTATDPVVDRPAPEPGHAPPPDLPLPPPAAPAAPPRAAPQVRETPPPSQAQTAARHAIRGAGEPAEPQAAGSSRAAGAVSPPGLLEGVRNPEPEYPLLNRQRGDQGVVTVLLRISEAGQVTDVDVIATSGHPALDDSARRTVQRWRFRPAMRDGVPVAGSIRTAIHFRLR